ncbi:lantibiotic dehydratase [Salinispora cortesiana]|uniref:lantibiotic dehydratase n=1 Tax=Salinispora cortesiana TaxID=1305843 RepID=UPI0003FBEB4B|nr:lantibiotic dehydratase [Salinispora cortesiana]
MTSAGRAHVVPLADAEWSTWRDVVLRSTGFPAELVLTLADADLSRAADDAGQDPDRLAAYQREYDAATARLSAGVRNVARSPRFREAVTWQNPKLLRQCLDKLVAGEPRNVRGRNHELTVASYLQRYCLKNDTIGFFGPVGWARWADRSPPLAVQFGDPFLSRRTVNFETWAVDAVALALTADPRLVPWLIPRRLSGHRWDGACLHVPGRPPVTLDPRETELIAMADGERTLGDLAAELWWSEFPELADVAALHDAYRSLADQALVRLDLVGPIQTNPEQWLLERLERVGDSAARDYAVGTVRRLVDARDRVAAAAGDDGALEQALADLAGCFQEITGEAGERRRGETYAGRTLVYEDTVLSSRVTLGPTTRQALAGPLGLLLASARWLVAEVGDEYDRLFRDLYAGQVARSGNPVVPLAVILGKATPQLFFNVRSLAEPVRRAVTEFQRRWAEVLRLPSGARAVQLRVEDLAPRVARWFPVRPAPWANAVHHSPDVLLAAADLDAVARGEFLFVLGELHLSFNTMESRVFVEQHDSPPAMLASAQADLGDRRIYAIPPKEWPGVSSRLAPPSSLLSPDYTYWTQHPEAVVPPGPIIPAAALTVRLEGDRLVVRSLTDGFAAPLSEVAAEFLSSAVVNAFKPVSGAHTARVTIDRLVVCRESWRFRAAEVAWTRTRSESERFLGARRWRTRHGLPERVYVKAPVEDKPTFVDLGSIVYVNLLAKLIRRSADRPDGWVTLTEMLPDMSQLWLTDAAGARYTAEFRMVAVDERARRRHERPRSG